MFSLASIFASSYQRRSQTGSGTTNSVRIGGPREEKDDSSPLPFK